MKKKTTNFTVYFDVDSALSFIECVPVHGPSPVREYFCYLWSAGRHLEGGPIGAGQKLHLGGGQYSPCQVQPHWGQWLCQDYSCVICFNYGMLINLVGYVKKYFFFHYFHYYTVSLLTLMSNPYMYQISFVPLCENLTSHKTFKKSYQKLENLLCNLIDKNYLLFSDIVEKNTQYDIFICSYFRQTCWEHVHQTVVFCCMIWGDLLHYERYI